MDFVILPETTKLRIPAFNGPEILVGARCARLHQQSCLYARWQVIQGGRAPRDASGQVHALATKQHSQVLDLLPEFLDQFPEPPEHQKMEQNPAPT
jgi:hypothetical protein